MNQIKIGLIGLDTSHVSAFTGLLNDADNPFHVEGGRVVAAFPGGSNDFALSRDRVAGFTGEIRDKYGVEILDSPAAVAQECDAILLTAVDGRAHPELFREIAPFGKPTFVDKPFAVSFQDAQMMANLAREHGVALMSSSSLRYSQALQDALKSESDWIGVDACGSMNIEPTQPGLFWYGIHTVEMIYTVLGRGCVRVSAQSNEDFDVVTGVWSDGRMATIRGNRVGNGTFGVLLHGAQKSHFVDAYADPKPGYAGLLEKIMPFFQGGKADVPIEETLEIVRFIEAANQARESGETVELAS